MSANEPERFEPNPSKLRRLRFVAGCCIAVCAVPVLQYLLSGHWQPHAPVVVLGYGWMGVYFLRRWWRAWTGTILTDEEGLWLANTPRETGLVRWNDLHATEWSRLPGALRLRDESGKVLAIFSMDLLGFGRLEQLLVDSTRDRPGGPVHALPNIYYAAFPNSLWMPIALAGIFFAIFSFEGWWVSWAILEISFVIAILIYMVEGPVRLKIEGGKLHLAYTLHERVIVRDEIESLSTGDPRRHEALWPWVGVILHRKWGKGPVVIRGLHYEPEDLLPRIEAWLAGDAPELHSQVDACSPSSARS